MKQLITILFFTIIGLKSTAQIVSTFDTGTEGWRASGDVTESVPDSFTTGGNPGGFIQAVDATNGGVWYWKAPVAYRGNHSSAYGYNLQFDLMVNTIANQFDNSDVIISGSGITIACDLSPNPGLAWTHYDVALDTTIPWKINTLSGAIATTLQIQQVLSDITDLRIRGEFRTGSDIGSLDNVILPNIFTLPVHNIDLKYKCETNGSALHWEIIADNDISTIEVESSNDGRYFKQIDHFKWNNNFKKYTYTFKSRYYQDYLFYRLSITDVNNKTTFSPVAPNSCSLSNRIEIFYSQNNKTIYLSGLQENSYVLRVANMQGQVIKLFKPNSQNNRIEINNLPGGMYVVSLNDKLNFKYSKLIQVR